MDRYQILISAVATLLLLSSVASAQSPDLSITKTADATPVVTGTPIGFTITVSNSNAPGTGTAFDVQLGDPLISPLPGVALSISPPYAGPGTCIINSPPSLSCHFGDLAPGASATIHLQS